jgi:hypothetical protein
VANGCWCLLTIKIQEEKRRKECVMRRTKRLISGTGGLLLALAVSLGSFGSGLAEAAKPYEGTTVKVIVNGEFLKYGMSLIEQALLDKHGIKLEVERSRSSRAKPL